MYYIIVTPSKSSAFKIIIRMYPWH